MIKYMHTIIIKSMNGRDNTNGAAADQIVYKKKKTVRIIRFGVKRRRRKSVMHARIHNIISYTRQNAPNVIVPHTGCPRSSDHPRTI